MKIFLNCVTGIIFKINLQRFMNEGSFGLLLTITLILIESEILTGITFFLEYVPRSDTDIKVHRQCGGGLYKQVLLLHSLPQVNLTS